MLFDLSHRAKFRITGSDRVRFLNGQLTNDLNRLHPGNAIHACALTAKGKLCADLFVAMASDAFYVDAEATLARQLLDRLERYLIADDVLIEEVDSGLFHLLGANGPELEGSHRFSCQRFRKPGTDFWFPQDLEPTARERFKESPVSPAEAESYRIQCGIPKWGAELSEEVIPVEAGLDATAISYTKGCYLGQEVISRIKSIGHVNRHLRALSALHDVRLLRGDILIGSDEKKAGVITSVLPEGFSSEVAALGYVRRGFDGPGSLLQVQRENNIVGSVTVIYPIDA